MRTREKIRIYRRFLNGGNMFSIAYKLSDHGQGCLKISEAETVVQNAIRDVIKGGLDYEVKK